MSQLLKDQYQGSPLRGLPTDDVMDTSTVTAVTGETVQLYYSNAGVRTIDAGQAAGVTVTGNTTYTGITNAAGDTQATTRDSSLSFTSTAFTTLKILSYGDMEAMDEMSFAEKLAFVSSQSSDVRLSANGDYCVDYRKGVLYGIKASTQVTLTSAAYKYLSHVSTATIAGTVAVSSVIPGTGATNLGKAEDAVHTSGDVGVMALAVRNDAGTALAADGDYSVIQVDSTGAVRTSTSLSGSVAVTQAAASIALAAYVVPTAAQTTAYAASLVAKGTAGTLFQVFGYNSHSATVFIQVHNTTSLPANASVPIITIAVPPTSNFSIDLGLRGSAFGTGITIASSSTGPTLTVSGSTAWINALYS